MAKRNTFRKALKQIKSVEIDEKLNGLNEQPTNSSKGVYSLNPSGWHNRAPSPAKTFYPDAEGNWPDGFPANPGDHSYTRPAGWWDNDSDWTNVRQFNLSVRDIGDDGKNTDGIIASNGYVLTPLPPGSRNFIQGPLVDGWVYNHGYDAYTNIGYIQKDTRQFVLLGRITGQWKDGHHYTGGSPAIWDGTSTGFTSYNENFTLEHAQWFRNQVLANRFTKNVPYNYSGGVPQRSPDWPDWVPPWLEDLLDNMFGGTAGGCGSGGDAADENLDSDAGFGDGGHGPDTGEEHTQGDPQSGDSGDANLWGPLLDKAKERLKDLGDKVGDSADSVRDFLKNLGGDAVETGRDLADSLRELLPPVMTPKEAIDDVQNKAKNLIDTIKDTPERTKEAVKDLLNDLDKLTDNVPALAYSKDIAQSILNNKPLDASNQVKPHEIKKLVNNLNLDNLDISEGEPKPYADDNIIVDNDGNVRSRAEWPKDKDGKELFLKKGDPGYEQYKEDINKWNEDNNNHPNNTGPVQNSKSERLMQLTMGITNPLAAAGQAQTQVVFPEDGSEPYLLYTDHAYHNLNSKDEGEVPGIGFINPKLAISKAVHAAAGHKDTKKENTGGMSGYPPNIRGDVVKNIKVPFSELPPEVQNHVNNARNNRNKSKSKSGVQESSLERWERILVQEIASAPAAPAPSPAPQSDAPTDRKSVTDGIAKDYLEKNGLDKTKQLLDNTEEFLAQEGEISVGKAEEIDWTNPDEVEKYFESNPLHGQAVADHTILKIILTLTKAGKIFNSIDGLLRGFNNWYNQGSTAWERTAKWGFRDTFEKLFKGQKVDGDTLWGRAWNLRQKSSADGSDFAPWRLLWTWAKDKGGWLSGPDPGTRELIRRFPTEMKQIFNTLKDVGNKYWIHDPINEMDSKEIMDEVLYNIPEDWLIPNYDKAIDKHPQMSRLSDQSETYYDELDLLRNLQMFEFDDPEIRQAYIDHNSAQWGGYTDWDRDSPTWNTWIEDPDSLYHLDEPQRFERAGVSYSQYQKHIDVAGRSSDGEIANFNQILDGQPGLTGLAGKAVEAGDKLREIEKRLPGQGRHQTDDKEEYDGWVKAQNEHGPAMTAYMKAFDAWDVEISKAGDMSELVSDKISQIRRDYETKYDDLLDKWYKKTEENNNRIEEIYMELDKITRKMEPYWEEIDRQIAIEYGEFKVAGWMEELDKMYDELKGKPMSPGTGKGRGMGDRWDPEKDGPPVDLPVHKALGVGDATTAATLAGHNRKRKRRGNHTAHMASYRPKGEVLRESIKFSDKQIKVLKEIKKPVEVKEEPIQKLRKYRPNFKGRYSPQNTPNVTASKQSDELVSSGVAKGQAWKVSDKNWSRYETAERMNVVYDKIGHGEQVWDRILDENKRKNGWKNREIQEQLNIIAHEKAMKQINADYESPWGMVIHEQETIDADNDPIVKVKDPLFKSVAKRLRKDIDYKDKPSSKGYPNDPPPKRVDGWHPKLGQRYKYDKLDPVSARAMPKQGNPEIDANIDKASNQQKVEGETDEKKPRVSSKFKMKGANVSNWRSERKLK